MDYRLIATDMDGSLLNSEVEISSRNIRALKKAYENNIYIVLATGRMYASANFYTRSLGFQPAIISNNGASLVDHKARLIYENSLSYSKLEEILESLEGSQLYFHLYGHDRIYPRKLDMDFLQGYYGLKDGGLSVDYEVFNELEELSKRDIKIYKILISSEDRTRLEAIRQSLSKIDGIEITSSWINNIEVMNKGVSKAKALETLCKKIDLDPSQVIAFGDNENDLDLIEYAGLGIAMGNGVDLLKARADYVTKTNDEDGLAYGLEKFVL